MSWELREETDSLDRLLREFFRGEMPHPWPEAPQPAAPRPRRARSRYRLHLALAASAAFLAATSGLAWQLLHSQSAPPPHTGLFPSAAKRTPDPRPLPPLPPGFADPAPHHAPEDSPVPPR
jgi:hypothetical protein